MNFATRWGLTLVFPDLQLLNSFENLDTVKAHFDAKVILQVNFRDMFNNLTIDADLLYKCKQEN